MDWKQELGSDIERARRQRGWTQAQLSTQAKCHINSIGFYERGKRAPDFDLLRRLAAALGRNHFDAGENMRIDFSSNGKHPPEQVPQQLELLFDDKRGVSVRIESVEDGIVIKKISA